MKQKTEFNVDKYSWHPSPLAGQIVLLTTVNKEGTVDVAPKSWVTMIAFNPPTIIVGCNRTHTTARNLMEVPEFVVNIPGESLVRRIYQMPLTPSPRSPENLGLTVMESLEVSPPSLAECPSCLECRLTQILDVGYENEVALFGEIVKARINEEALHGENIDRYSSLRPVFFLEEGTYGVIDAARSVGHGYTNLECFVVNLTCSDEASEHLSEHLEFIKTLQTNGVLISSGSFPDESGGMYILKTGSLKEARAIVENDPYVKNADCQYKV
jgi:flavin reductase (DIM6/NTAB) family NADH-FMN oxidoreductase RutF/uncharacterized protein YciI